jgi:hypothetical protein
MITLSLYLFFSGLTGRIQRSTRREGDKEAARELEARPEIRHRGKTVEGRIFGVPDAEGSKGAGSRAHTASYDIGLVNIFT